jgi:hypothetical protein
MKATDMDPPRPLKTECTAMTFGTAMQGNPKMMDSILSAIGISQKFPYELSTTNVLSK